MKKLLALLICLLLPICATAEDPIFAADGATITVTGSAVVTLKADYARINVGVSTQAKTVEEASRKNTAAIHNVIDTLVAAGVAEADIATSSYSVHAEYDYSSLGGQKLTGYNVTNQLTVVLRDMTCIGATLDKATAAGANSIYNIEFLSTKADAAQDEATTHAVSDAMRKARLLADAAGLELGGILSLTESTGSVYVAARNYAFKDMVATSNSILPDDTSVSASVTIVFELK